MQLEVTTRHRVPFAALAGILLLASLLFTGGAFAAPKLHTLYSFCQQSGCTDGKRPTQKLTMDSAGNLYGTTEEGGTQDSGIVFELVKNGDGYDFRKLHDFCSEADCADGGARNKLGAGH